MPRPSLAYRAPGAGTGSIRRPRRIVMLGRSGHGRIPQAVALPGIATSHRERNVALLQLGYADFLISLNNLP